MRRDRTVDVFVRKLREKIDARSTRHVFLHRATAKIDIRARRERAPQPAGRSKQ